MDDGGEEGLSFVFEGGLETVPTHLIEVVLVNQPQDHNNNNTNLIPNNAYNAPVPNQGGDGSFVGNRRSFRQIVCRHWFCSLCMNGNTCGFLHLYNKSRMPICRFFRLYDECREQDCVYKHTNEDIKECNR
ncbi:30-kDa cleavage and polyadenylation specificity factor 30-like [Lycium ferocissimum]|uniref:30-kDa cleavage and polyadenylation specificity factor 30-like n=1 Tax=Lycium ferocissimum TaxID=112874 RepID=UPI002814A4D2|nr:30-kDa cleavage and polyadenylation specificity factor 30-like [Lycium ferocissimum]